MAKAIIQNMGCIMFKERCLSTIKLNDGNNKETVIIARTKAMNVKMNDSQKNCTINCFLFDPSVFLMPTSFARFSLLAVERFMKLIHAINKMIIAMMENKRTYSIMPPVFLPFSKSLYKCQRLIGKTK